MPDTAQHPAFKPFACGLPGMIAAVSVRGHGNQSLRHGDTSRSRINRRLFLEKLLIDPASLVCAEQTHSDAVHYAKQSDRGTGALQPPGLPGVDAFITDAKQVPVAVFTADCCGVFLADPVRPAIGLAHAGWLGTALGIVSKTLSLMRERFGTDPAVVKVAFAPSIRGCCYEVGDDVSVRFPAYTRERGGKRYLDLVEVNTEQLLNEGVLARNIFDARLCTACGQTPLFSYRKEGKECGRMMSVCMLK